MFITFYLTAKLQNVMLVELDLVVIKFARTHGLEKDVSQIVLAVRMDAIPLTGVLVY